MANSAFGWVGDHQDFTGGAVRAAAFRATRRNPLERASFSNNTKSLRALAVCPDLRPDLDKRQASIELISHVPIAASFDKNGLRLFRGTLKASQPR